VRFILLSSRFFLLARFFLLGRFFLLARFFLLWRFFLLVYLRLYFFVLMIYEFVLLLIRGCIPPFFVYIFLLSKRYKITYYILRLYVGECEYYKSNTSPEARVRGLKVGEPDTP